MMSDVAIRVESLGKRYRIGTSRTYKTLRESLNDALAAPFRAARSVFRSPSTLSPNRASDTIWALKDVSLEIQRGEAVGIIGRNGAGKSTLLKILSRITRPTEGYADVYGRVGSLLEVGTGFHPELTGRENIFLNGAILGMKRAEIMHKFNEIVAFSEVEKFIDTPVKYYSSGMYVRLAFAVAAHLEPDILLIDEVLAVGDLAFQRKCLDRVAADTHNRNVTALYVSHNLSTIKSLCVHALLLDEGRLIRYGAVNDVCNEYSKYLSDGIVSAIHRTRLFKSEEATVYDCWCEVGGQRVSQLALPDRIQIRALVDIHTKCSVSFEITVKDDFDQPFAFAQYGLAKRPPLELSPGRYTMVMHFPYLELATGRYSFDVSIGEPNRKFYDYIQDALTLDVLAPADRLTGWSFNQNTRQGSLLLECELSID